MASKFEISTTAAGKFHFVLKAGNGEVILSSQSYTTKDSAKHGVESVRANAKDDARFVRKTSSAGEAYFVLEATNGQVIGQSQMYSSKSAMEGGVASVKANAADARLEDLT